MNLKDNKNVLKEAQQLLERLESGKTYPADYVVSRFQKAASAYSTDQLIGNMRDVLIKVASKRQYFSQNEIGKLYDEMYGLSGGQTAFRDVLGDLLPEGRQFAKIAYSGSKSRKMEENALEPIHKSNDLSNAFSVLFSLGGDSSFGTYKPADNRGVEKAVIAKLNSIGYAPLGVDIVQSNEHFTLCAANYQTQGFDKVSAFIPVQTTDGVVQEPKVLVLGEQILELDSRNLFLALKEQERNLKSGAKKKFASERGDGSPQIEIEKMVVPTSLESFTDIENSLILAASKFSTEQVKLATQMLGHELKGMGLSNANIKVAGADKTSILFDVFIPTKIGKVVVHIPVEIQNNTVLMPNRFATDHGVSDQKIHQFDKRSFDKFLTSLDSNSHSLNIARHSGDLSKMSYHQLIDRMIEGVATQDYRLSEDTLQIIENRFGSEKFMVAFDQFTQLLKHSSGGKKRDELIKAAFERGDLIKVPTSVDLYCPKLGLSVNKVTFDEKGRVIAKGRRSKSDNQIQDAAISNSRILLT